MIPESFNDARLFALASARDNRIKASYEMYRAIRALVNSKTVYLTSENISESRKLYKQLRAALDKAEGVK